MFNALFSVSLGAFISGMYAGFVHTPVKNYIYDIYKTAGSNALLGLAFVPGDLKFLWIHYLENINIPFAKVGLKKKMLIFLDFALASITFGFYYFRITNLSNFIIYLAFFAAFMSLRDSIAVGYKMEFFPKDIIGDYVGIINAAYNIGLWVGGGLLMIFASNLYFNAVSWLDIFFYCSIFFYFNAFLDLFITNSKEYEQVDSNTKIDFSKIVKNISMLSFGLYLLYYFFHLSFQNINGSLFLSMIVPKIGQVQIALKHIITLALVLAIILFSRSVMQNKELSKMYDDLFKFDRKQFFILFGFLISYKIAARLIMGNIIPLFSEKFGESMYMFWYKTVSSFLTLLNIWLLPYLCRTFSRKTLRILVLMVYAIPTMFFIFSLSNVYLVFAVCIFERFCRSVLEEVYFLSKTDMCGKKNAMSQLTLLSSIEKIFSNIILIGSGYLVDLYSWNLLFKVALISIFPALFFAMRVEGSDKN